MIDAKLIKKNKQRLLEEKKRLEKLLSRVAKKDPKTGDFHATYEEIGNKEDENAAEVAIYAEHVAEEHDLEQKFRKVVGALERIAAGTYGICVRGGEQLPVARLEAVPEAQNCVRHEQ